MKKILILSILFFSIYWGARILSVWEKPNSDSNARVSVSIKPGTSVVKISEILEQKDLIRDAFVFRLYIKHHDLTPKLQAGDYIIQKNLTFAEVAQLLQNGKTSEQKITIPEGYTITQIDQLLAKKGLINPGDFQECARSCDLGFRVDSLEGWLYPSTYYISTNSFSSKKFITRLYRTMQQKLSPLTQDIQVSGRTKNETMIVASMIEREAFGDSLEEKKIIASIIWKRLDERIHLGIDATTRYEKNDWKGPLYAEDFAIKSPYNTRKNLGLPPTAISNPSIESIKAAIYPQETPYYYYLHDNSGQIHFGRTLEEHNQNKRKYLW